jgi:hypothetical protein
VMRQATAWTVRRGCMSESVLGVAAGQPVVEVMLTSHGGTSTAVAAWYC